MNFLKNLFGKNETPQANKEDLPKTFVLIPEKLTVKVFLHDVITKDGALKCLAYLTDGLRELGQKELLLVLRNAKEIYEILEDPLRFFLQVYSFAEEGRIVNHGDITQFGDRDIWGWKGIVYSNVPIAKNEPTFRDCLAMILLTLEEVQAVQKFGYLRIASLLGKENSYFPHPYWSDLNRKPLPIKEIEEQSVADKMRARITFPSASVRLQNNEIILNLPKDISPQELPGEALPADFSVGIFPGLYEDADSCLVFTTDGQGPGAITDERCEASIMSGCILLIAAGQESNFTRIFEDGFGLSMTNETWEEFWHSLINRKNMDMQTEEGSMNFKIVWE